jgi:type IV pilus assembly protein PilY1
MRVTDMNILRTLRLALTIGIAVALAPAAFADDIDIFAGSSGGGGDAPNVMILIDNSDNWARQSQQWPDNGGNQGQAEIAAIIQVLKNLTTPPPGSPPPNVNVGLAMLTTNSGTIGTGGAYIRFGARNMNVAANSIALQNILNAISNSITSASEKVAIAHKDETEGFYEIYKYYSGLAPYAGGYPANGFADVAGNNGGGPSCSGAGCAGLTGAAQGLTSGFAIANGVYQSPITANNPCSKNYIIYIANNAQGSSGSGPWENYYEPVVPALTALPAVPAGGGDTWTDEWTRFLLQSGAQVPATNNNGSIVTYVLDAWNAQDNAEYSKALNAAAKQGGGRYFQVGNVGQIQVALAQIFEQIQAVNATFASASLPVNASNRAQDRNQVYVPMFRPDANLQPRWYGNLKQYQLINLNNTIQLGDANNQPVINLLTGFPTACAASFWTSDSTAAAYPNGYWNFGQSTNAAGNTNITMEITYAKGTCPTDPYSVWADMPDGPTVEKGGVAEVIRKGNNPPATDASPTWTPAQRTVKTVNAAGTLVSFNAANTGLADTNLVNWMLGKDVQDENGNGTTTETRPSVHGDEIHSRPVPVDYGAGVTRVFYGSNDGTLRAVDGSTGQELWAFVAPEFYTPAPTPYVVSPLTTPTGLERLMWSGMTDANGNQISPIINFPNIPAGQTPTPKPKDYYFDGSIGLYEGPTNAAGAPSSVWIYPTMRRGGRMIYAMDVTNPSSPSVLWKFGCPHLADNNLCVPGSAQNVTSIGQTWSIPAATASVLGYSSPVLIVGGGYDACEDANTTTPACGTATGRGVFVLDAYTGAQLAFFPTTRSVAADVALISVAMPGVVDHAYVADTGGNIYRIDFASSQAAWAMNLIAYTNGAGRKFLFPPALLAAPGNQVYVAIGSGDREHPLQSQYPYTQVLNRFYVLKDNLASTSSISLDDTTKMLDLTYDAADPSSTGITTGTSCSTTGILPNSSMNGWFVDLNMNGQGEQTVTSAIIAAGMVAFSTNRPIPQAQGTCSTALGAAYGYWLNLFNASGGISANGQACGGLRDTPFVGGGLPPSPVIATVPVNGVAVNAVIGASQLSGGTSCGICAQQMSPAIIPKRNAIFWKSSGEN